MSNKDHWNDIYGTKKVTTVSWFREHLERSLELIEDCRLPKEAAIIDVGSGASPLVGDLIDRGYSNITLLDLSETALAKVEACSDKRSGVT